MIPKPTQWIPLLTVLTMLLVGCSGLFEVEKASKKTGAEEPEKPTNLNQTWYVRLDVKNRNCYIEGGQKGVEITEQEFFTVFNEQLQKRGIRLNSDSQADVPLTQLLITQTCQPRQRPETDQLFSIAAVATFMATPIIHRNLYTMEVELWQEGRKLRDYKVEVPFQQLISFWTGSIQAFLFGDDAKKEVNLDKGRVLAAEGIERLLKQMLPDSQMLVGLPVDDSSDSLKAGLESPDAEPLGPDDPTAEATAE